MEQYQSLVAKILKEGVSRPDRTGVGSMFLPGYFMQFDLSEGFPAVTTKNLAFKNMVGETIGFLRGYDNAEDFRALGCTVWDANANADGIRPNAWLRSPHRKGTDDLGRIYGVQWRNWATDEEPLDQVLSVLEKLRTQPNDRRMIVNAWRPEEFNKMALPPCHVLHHFLADTANNTLHLNMFQRSVDTMLGLPFNIAQYALILHIMAKLSGFNPGKVGMMLSDVHIYHNHFEAAKELVSRTPRPSPKLVITGKLATSQPWALLDTYGGLLFEHITPDDFTLGGYSSWGKLVNRTPMNV